MFVRRCFNLCSIFQIARSPIARSNRCSRDRQSLDPNCLRKAGGKDKGSDTESMVSSHSDTRITQRRSWVRIRSSGRDEALVRRRPKPLVPGHSRSSSVCIQMRSNDSAVETPVPRNVKKVTAESSIKTRKSSRRSEASMEAAAVPSPRATTEEKILWGSLPANLLMLGKVNILITICIGTPIV